MELFVQRLNLLLDYFPDFSLVLRQLRCGRGSSVGSDVLHELSDLVRVLARGRYLDRASPIEVEMAKWEGKLLNFKLCQWRVVFGHKEVSWEDATLSCVCRSQVEVKFVVWILSWVLNKTFINDAPWRRIHKFSLVIFDKESLRNSLVYHNHSDFWFFRSFVRQLGNSFLKLGNFSSKDLFSLSVTDTITENNVVCRELSVVLFRESHNRLLDHVLHVVADDFLTFFLNKVIWVILTHLRVRRSRKPDNWLRSSMTHINAD